MEPENYVKMTNKEFKALVRKRAKQIQERRIKNYRTKQINDAVVKLTEQLNQQMVLDHLTHELRVLTTDEKRNIVLNAQRLNAERFLKDNERIWSVSTLFIPLSLAGLSSLKDKNFFIAMLLAVASMGLITFWYLASEKLRRFQDMNLDSVEIYNLYLGINTNTTDIKRLSPKLIRKKKPSLGKRFMYWNEDFMHFLRDTTIQQARLYMYRFVMILWTLVLISASVDNVVSPDSAIRKQIVFFFKANFNFYLH